MSNDQSSPTEDCDSEVSDLTSQYDEDDFRKKYVIRFTPQGKYTLDEVAKWLETYFEFWVIGVEMLPQVHYHIVIEGDNDLKEMKELVRGFIYQYWPEGERKRGFGNAQYNCQEADPNPEGFLNASISYALKDKEEYLFEGYEQEYIDECIKQSYKKKAPANFKLEYMELCKKFMEVEMDQVDFMADFTVLKAKYGQQVRVIDAYGFYNSNLIAKHGRQSAVDLIESFLYKL